MPMTWVEPELFMEYKGVSIWHTYVSDFDNRNLYWFTADMSYDDTEHYDEYVEHNRFIIFDVRDLPSWRKRHHGWSLQGRKDVLEPIRLAIQDAIEDGTITQEGMLDKEHRPA